ncbi:MAG: hypothetical protein ACK4P3_06935 [Fimbriimonadaceae bacterium]
MLWIQAAISFVLWVIFGWSQRRQGERLAPIIVKIPRGMRSVIAIGLLFLSIVILFGALLGLARIGHLSTEGLTALGWILFTFAGLIFIQLQFFAAFLLLSLAIVPSETTKPRKPSETEE